MSAGRRVLFFSTGLQAGGAETQLVRLAEGLRERDWSPRIVTLIEGGEFDERLLEAGISQESLGARSSLPNPISALSLLRIARRERPEVLCSFMAAANVIGRPVGRLARVPVVVSSVRQPIQPTMGHEWGTRVTRRFHDAVVFNSAVVSEDAIARKLVRRARVRVVRNGLDFAPYDEAGDHVAATRESLGLATGDFVWLCVAHLRAEKNPVGLIRAFRSLVRTHPHAQLMICGSFRDAHAEVLKVGAELIDSGRLRLLGRRTDVPRLMAAADAFVLPSHYESSPNALIEAMAARMPAVAPAVGGVVELIRDRRNGLLTGTSADEHLLQGLTAMKEMAPEQRAAMGEAGRSHVEGIHGLSRFVDEWEELFLELLRARTPSGRSR